MKLNVLLPWICVLSVSAGLAAVFVSSQAKDAGLVKLRAEAAQVQQLQTQLEAAQIQSKNQAGQIADLRKDNQELLRLRNEVGQLRNEKQQLAKQVAAAQGAAQQVQAQLTQTAQTTAQQLQQMQTQNSELRTTVVQQGQQANQRNACLNNLRQLDAAKQQWALEHGKTADASPTAQDIAPYLAGQAIPVCPAGGAYTLKNLSSVPVCSIPGHVLQ